MWAFYAAMPAGATASMQRDIMDGRPSELEAWNGAVCRFGARAGVETPCTRSRTARCCRWSDGLAVTHENYREPGLPGIRFRQGGDGDVRPQVSRTAPPWLCHSCPHLPAR